MNDSYNNIIETLDRIILKMEDMERKIEIMLDEVEKFRNEVNK